MKIILSFCISFYLTAFTFAQISPDSYILGDEAGKLPKQNSSTPLSNTITDVISIGDTIWLGTSRGVSLSIDNGENWTNFYGQSDFGTDNVSAIGYYKGMFWCATASSTVENGQSYPVGTGLKYTTNLGATWISIPQSVDPEDDTLETYGINIIDALPITVAVNNLAYDIAFTPNHIWITTFAGGIRRAKISDLIADPNSAWKRIVIPPDFLNSISPNDTLNFCLSPVGGNFCSSGNLNHRVFSVVAANDSTVYVGTANGVNKTTDANSDYPSWVKFNATNQNQPISGNFITALGFNPLNNTVWASSWKAEGESEFYGVSSSSNGGASWNTYLRDERPHNFGFKNYDVMVATDNGVFRSSDFGHSWLLPGTITDQVTRLSLQTNEFYSCTSSGNYVYLGSTDGFVRLQETPGRIYQGVWKIYFAAQSLAANDETYCYPNPFNPRMEQLKIKYSTGGTAENVSIRIFDFGFNYVRTVIQNVERNYSVDGSPDFWDGKDENGSYVPNGVYFYRVAIGDKDPVYGKILVMQ